MPVSGRNKFHDFFWTFGLLLVRYIMELELGRLAQVMKPVLGQADGANAKPVAAIAHQVYRARRNTLVPGVAVIPALLGCLFLSGGMSLFVSSAGKQDANTAIESVSPDSIETIWEKEVRPFGGVNFHLTLDLKNTLKATDARSGRVLWTERMPSIASSSAPLVFTEQEKVFVSIASEDGAVYLINGINGHVLWMQNVSDRVDVSPLQVKNRIIAVACADGKVYGLSVADGHIEYMVQTDSQITALEPVADGHGDHIYAIADKKRVMALNAMTGDLHWRRETAGTATDSPILAANRIIAPTADGDSSKLWAFDDKGELNWMNTYGKYTSLASAEGYIAMAQGNVITLIKAETGEPVYYGQLNRTPSELHLYSTGKKLVVQTDQGALVY